MFGISLFLLKVYKHARRPCILYFNFRLIQSRTEETSYSKITSEGVYCIHRTLGVNMDNKLRQILNQFLDSFFSLHDFPEEYKCIFVTDINYQHLFFVLMQE